MALEKRCKSCKKKFCLSYFQMCHIYGSMHVWSHKCPHCGGNMRTPWAGEVPIAVSSIILSVALAYGMLRPSHEFIVIIAAMVISYFLSGAFRYLFLSVSDLSYFRR
jgi:hypothetical protein